MRKRWKNRWLSLFLFGLFLVSMIPMWASDGNAAWEDSDFTMDGTAVTGFTDQGEAKLVAKIAMGDMDLHFPEAATEIRGGAFENKGLVGTITFHESINSVGNDAFMKNPKIRKVVVKDSPSEKMHFGMDCFNPSGIKVNRSNVYSEYQDYVSTYVPLEKGELSELVLGERSDYSFYFRAFINSSLTELKLPESSRVVMNEYPFFASKLQKISSWGNLKGEGGQIGWIGEGAFAHNELEEITLPTNVYGHFAAFAGNASLKKINFPANAESIVFFRQSFLNSGLEGTLEIPAAVSTIGGYGNFIGTKLEKVIYPNIDMTIGRRQFEGVSSLHSLVLNTGIGIEQVAFYKAGLKNIDFKNVKYDRIGGADGIQPAYLFHSNKLKALEIPHFLLPDAMQGKDAGAKHFIKNLGWKTGDSRVALYRKDFTTGEYVTDNLPADVEKEFVINPVDFDPATDVKAMDAANQPMADVISELNISRNGTPLAASSDYKLGDQIRFDVTVPSGYELEMVADQPVSEEQKKNGGNFTVTLLGDRVYEVAYGDGYEVGFQKAKEIQVKLKALPPVTPFIPGEEKPDETKPDETKPDVTKPGDNNPDETPSTPPTPITPTEPPKENPPANVPYVPEKIEGQIPAETVVEIINEEGISLGKAIIDVDNNTYTFVDDDRIPQGKAKIRKDNVLEIIDEDIPESGLPKTSGIPFVVSALMGVLFLKIGFLIKK